MRELTLLETSYLAGLVLLSLVLPMMLSVRSRRNPQGRRSGLKIVWLGQSCGAAAGMLILASAMLAPYAAAFGLVSCFICAVVLMRNMPTRKAV